MAAAAVSTAATAATTTAAAVELLERGVEGTHITVLLANGSTRAGCIRQRMKRSVKILTNANDIEIVSFEDITSFTLGGCTTFAPLSRAPPSLSMSPACTTDRHARDGRVPLVLDLETGDPDDIMTLMLAACHPGVQLKAVTVTPGSLEQLQVPAQQEYTPRTQSLCW